VYRQEYEPLLNPIRTFFARRRGKLYVTEKEYERVELNVSKGEKKLVEVKNMEDSTRILVGVFSNAWEEVSERASLVEDENSSNTPWPH